MARVIQHTKDSNHERQLLSFGTSFEKIMPVDLPTPNGWNDCCLIGATRTSTALSGAIRRDCYSHGRNTKMMKIQSVMIRDGRYHTTPPYPTSSRGNTYSGHQQQSSPRPIRRRGLSTLKSRAAALQLGIEFGACLQVPTVPSTATSSPAGRVYRTCQL